MWVVVVEFVDLLFNFRFVLAEAVNRTIKDTFKCTSFLEVDRIFNELDGIASLKPK